jgi:HEAT repeat protein
MLAPGDVACFRAGSDALVASVPTEATLALVLASSTVDRERRIYAADTLRAERVVSADPGASRLEFAARVLAELGGAGATPRLVRLTGHPAHFVRWTALQSLARVDGAAARDALRAALDDPHPHVRNAAGRALARSS